ncbi:response regulator [Deltaproteobacteria bacterium TL4]
MGSTILVVDDDPQIEKTLRQWFDESIKSQKFNFIFIPDGKEALTYFKNHEEIELILTDIDVPGMDGLSLLAKLQTVDRLFYTIIITAHSDMHTIRRAMNRGAFDFLIKPLDFKDMKITITQAFEDLKLLQDTIKARNEAENLLLKSIERYRMITETARDAIITIDEENNILFANSAAEEIFGYKVSELYDQKITMLMPDSLRNTHQTALKDYILNSKKHMSWETIEFPGHHKEGHEISVEVSFGEFIEEGKHLFTGVIRDISERKRAEEQYIRLATAIEQAAESIVITDAEGIIQYVNPAFERVSQYSNAEVLNKNAKIVKSGKHDKIFYKNMWAHLVEGKVWSGRITNKRKDGSLYEEEATISPIRNAANKIVSYVAVKRDITREGELEKQLRHSQKMEAIGTLAGGIAHDFNNILFAVLGYLALAKEGVAPDTLVHKDLEEALLAGNRARDLVRQILSFSRQEESELQPFEITPILKEVLKLLRSTTSTTIEIRQELTSEKLTLIADPTQVHQVIMNLCTNAIYAMRDQEGVLEVRLEKAEVDEEFAKNHMISEGPYVKLVIRDTGSGIPAHLMDRIFEPFFTTKPVGEGTGLGLSVVHGIVQNHKGAITVSSKEGDGSMFTVYFPVISKTLTVPPKLESVYHPGKGRILIVDDEQMLVELEKRILERCGYEVVTFTSSLDVLSLIRAQPNAFDLVLTDQSMPKMTGLQLAKALRQINPDLPVILITGHPKEVTAKQAIGSGVREHVIKPIDASELSQVVARVLEKSSKNFVED